MNVTWRRLTQIWKRFRDLKRSGFLMQDFTFSGSVVKHRPDNNEFIQVWNSYQPDFIPACCAISHPFLVLRDPWMKPHCHFPQIRLTCLSCYSSLLSDEQMTHNKLFLMVAIAIHLQTRVFNGTATHFPAVLFLTSRKFSLVYSYHASGFETCTQLFWY